jgi:hypothetical protein
MGPNRRAQERERAAARAADEAKRAEVERKDVSTVTAGTMASICSGNEMGTASQ